MFPRVLLSSDALKHNLAVVRRFAPRSRVLAVIKANGYGHGIVPVARALSAADAFGVARLCEAVELRGAGVDHRILLHEGVFSIDELERAAALNLEIVVHSFEQLAMLESRRGSHRFAVWCKVDTGMSRLGFTVDEFPAAWARLQRCNGVATGTRVMTHFAVADESGNALTAAQLAKFSALTAELDAELSLANSAGVIQLPEAHADWVRPGIMLYGISPIAGKTAADFALKPAMTLESSLIAVRTAEKGQSVGYGARWSASVPTRIGVVAVGYADGYPRHARDGTPVLLGNRVAPGVRNGGASVPADDRQIPVGPAGGSPPTPVGDREVVLAGRVSMDMISIDLTNAPQARVGDRVVLWGEGLPIERVAAAADTIGYELVCKITPRVERHWE